MPLMKCWRWPPFCDKDVFTPIRRLNHGFGFLGFANFFYDFDQWLIRLRTIFGDDFLAALREESSAHFLIENAAVVFPAFEFRLIASDD